MYAVIQTGGKQYRIQKDAIIEVEKLVPSKSKEVIFKEVLLCVDKEQVVIGQPFIKDARVVAEFLDNIRLPKILTYKYKRRKSYHRTIGHRQDLVRLRIKEIIFKEK